MPYKSERQRRAMGSASRGAGKLGISKSVGQAYISHGKPKRRRNGLMPNRMKELKG